MKARQNNNHPERTEKSSNGSRIHKKLANNTVEPVKQAILYHVFKKTLHIFYNTHRERAWWGESERKVCGLEDMCDMPRLPGCCRLSITWYPLYTITATNKCHGQTEKWNAKQFYLRKVTEREKNEYDKKCYLYKYVPVTHWDEKLHIL